MSELGGPGSVRDGAEWGSDDLAVEGVKNVRARRVRRVILRALLHGVVVCISLMWLVPLLDLGLGSIRTESDTASSGWWDAIAHPLFTGVNYSDALDILDFWGGLATSLAISVPVTVLTVTLSAMAAFALTKMKFRGSMFVSLFFVAMLVIPPQITLVPMLKLFEWTHLTDTVPSIWIYQVAFTIPFGVFLICGFIADIPDEIIESALIDRASLLRIFAQLVVPLVSPALVALAIIQFMWSWNDLLIPLLFLSGSEHSDPLTVGVSGLVQATGQGHAALLAATCLAVVIPVILIIALQRFFVRGIVAGSVKG